MSKWRWISIRAQEFKPRHELPGPLWAMMIGFALLPLWALAAMPLPWLLAAQVALPNFFLVLFSYYIFPLLLSALIYIRSFVLIPFFWLECLALIAHSLQDVDGVPPALRLLRFLLLGVMAIVGTLLLRKDMLYPLLNRGQRGWRRAPRVELNHRALVYSDEAKQFVKAMIENCSTTGMAIAGSEEDFRPFLRSKKRGDSLRVRFHLSGEEFEFDATLMWFETREPMVRMGVHVAGHTLDRTLKALGQPHAKTDTSGRLQHLWASNALNVALIGLWGASLGVSVSVPACGRIEPSVQLSIAESKTDRRSGADLVNVGLSVTTSSVGSSELQLAANKFSYTAAVVDCLSGYTKTVTQVTVPQLPVPLGDKGCHLVIEQIWLNGVLYNLPSLTSLKKGNKAVNTYFDTAGDSLLLVTVVDLPSRVTAPTSVSFHVMEVDASSDAVSVPIPAHACTLTFGKITTNTWGYVVTVHPVYLSYATKLSVQACKNSICQLSSIGTATIAYANNFFTASTSQSADTAVATVTIGSSGLAQQAATQGKSLTCSYTASTALPH